jgi:hypothetical protein
MMTTTSFNLSITGLRERWDSLTPITKNGARWEVKLNGKRVGYVVKVSNGYEPRSPGDVPIFHNVLGDKVQAAFACVVLFREVRIHPK